MLSKMIALRRNDCTEAGKVGGDTRRQVEAITGQPVVSSVNYRQLQHERQRELQPSLFDDAENEHHREMSDENSEK